MSNIPTAEEFLNNQKHTCDLNGNLKDGLFTNDVINFMKEFAKLHVKAAIKECIESAPSGSSTDTVSYEDVVNALTDCYPLTNIK
jgi:hypothetical protein